jgi:dTDP-glucose pyrophosphorylase
MLQEVSTAASELKELEITDAIQLMLARGPLSIQNLVQAEEEVV